MVQRPIHLIVSKRYKFLDELSVSYSLDLRRSDFIPSSSGNIADTFNDLK